MKTRLPALMPDLVSPEMLCAQLEGSDAALIRPVESGDTDEIYQALCESLPEMSPWLPWCGPDYSLEEAARWSQSRAAAWAVGEAYDFAIVDPITKKVAGVCGLTSISRDNNFANLGYWVRTSRTGRGLASFAARRVARFGFEELGLARIEIVVSIGNIASQRAAEKTGAKREGILRNRSLVHGRSTDAVMFSLIPSDL